jgi:hypothetical protein
MSRIKKHKKQATQPKTRSIPGSKQSPFEHDKPWPGPRPIKPRQSGQALGAGIARLSGAQAQRAENMASAIVAGQRAAALRDEVTSELSQDSKHLRTLGFWGRNDDD